MYIAQITKTRIKERCKSMGLTMEQMLTDCGLGINAVRQISDAKGMSSVGIAKIADVLDCSVDFLLGRTDEPTSIALSPDDKRKAIQARIMNMTEDELKRLEDILNYVTARTSTD